MKRCYIGVKVEFPYDNGEEPLRGILTGICKDGEKEGIEIDGEFYHSSRFDGVEPHLTKYDLSVLIRDGATIKSLEGIN
jgi:hypothetical protein